MDECFCVGIGIEFDSASRSNTSPVPSLDHGGAICRFVHVSINTWPSEIIGGTVS